MPTAFDFVKKNVRSAVSNVASSIDQGRTDLANQQVAANNAAMQTPIQAPEVKAPSNPAQDALNNEMLGRLMKPGRGRRKGQMVTSGGRYSGRTVDEIYGKLQQNGSGAGGGLRTGSLSQGSGIDWLKANRTSGKALARQEANVGATGDRLKSAPKKMARPAMTQAPAVVDTKPMNMGSAVTATPQPVVTSPIAKAMASPAVAAPQVPAIMPKAPVTAPASPMRPALPNMPNQFQPPQMSMASARPAAIAAPMTQTIPMTAAPNSVNTNPINLGRMTSVASAPKPQPRPVAPAPTSPTIPTGLARTPSYMTPPSAAPVAGQRVPANDPAAAMKRSQEQAAAQAEAKRHLEMQKRSYLGGR